jgi:hypothetical protein
MERYSAYQTKTSARGKTRNSAVPTTRWHVLERVGISWNVLVLR